MTSSDSAALKSLGPGHSARAPLQPQGEKWCAFKRVLSPSSRISILILDTTTVQSSQMSPCLFSGESLSYIVPVCNQDHATPRTSNILFQRIHRRHQFESEPDKSERSFWVQVYHRPVVTVALRRLKKTRSQVCTWSRCPSGSPLYICRIWFVKDLNLSEFRIISSWFI